MNRSFQAELVKLLRRRVLLVASATIAVFALGASAIVLAAARPAAEVTLDRGLTIEGLADPGGGTEVFRSAMSFAGFFVFVVFVGAIAAEFGRGTFRTMLLRQPARLRLLAGKMAGLLAVAGAVLAVGEVLGWVTARVLAPSHGVDAGAWASFDGLAAAGRDYGTVVIWVTGYALLGMAVALLIRSVPVALAVGIAWAGPFEHIVQDAWEPASRFFPGLLLEAFVAGGTPEVDASRALLTLSAYVLAAVGVAGAAFVRRDVAA